MDEDKDSVFPFRVKADTGNELIFREDEESDERYRFGLVTRGEKETGILKIFDKTELLAQNKIIFNTAYIVEI